MRTFGRKPGFWPVALGASLSSVAANAQAIEPSGDWQYRQDAEACRAFRSFGSAEDDGFITLHSFGPGSAVEVTVASSKLPREPGSARLAEVGWDDRERNRDQLVVLGSLEGVPTATFLTSTRITSTFFKGRVDRLVLGQSTLPPSVDTLQLRVSDAPPMSFDIGSLEQPLDQLARCESALTQKWGWGEDDLQHVGSTPKLLNPESFTYTISYPAVGVINRIAGIAELRVRVAPNGKVTDCVVQSSPGTSRFGNDTCKTIRQKIRYSPARSPASEPVEGLAQLAVIFAIFN